MGIRRDTVLRRMKKAMTIVNNKDTWARSYNALDAEDEEVEVSSNKAVRFCATGAVDRVTLKDSSLHSEAILKRLYRHLPKEFRLSDDLSTGLRFNEIDAMIDDIQSLNDNDSCHSRRRVVGVFNRAIKELEAELDA